MRPNRAQQHGGEEQFAKMHDVLACSFN